jgi:hypothetical protein
MSHDQEVTRDAVTGRYESPQDKGPEDYTATEEHLSPWQKEWRRIGMEIESLTDSWNESDKHGTIKGLTYDPDKLDVQAVQAVIHIQSLKRP